MKGFNFDSGPPVFEESAIGAPEIEALMAADFVYVKRDTKTQAGVAVLPDGRKVFVRRFVARSWINGVFDHLRGSRAARSLRGARLLREAGLAYPRPLATAAVCSWGSIRLSYLITEYLQDAYTPDALFARGADAAAHRRVISALAAEVRRLHALGLYSWDMKSDNLMLDHSGGALRIFFVDLMDFRRGRVTRWRRCLNLAQLDTSAGRSLSRSERMRFIQLYAAGSGTNLRRLVAEVLRHERRLARRAATVGAGKK
jgi:tRNA A-37 threonylcarbamoyl transferase component Bud32